MELPRFSSSLRDPFDSDQAYINRKSVLESLSNRNRLEKAVDEFEVARKIVHRWDEASIEVRQAYQQFAGAVVELIDGVVKDNKFKEAALAVYRLVGAPVEEEEVNRRIIETKSELQKLLGHAVSHAKVQKVVNAAQTLSNLQPDNHKADDDGQEFGANFVFHQPARFLVDASFEDGDLWGESTNERTNHHPVSGTYDLEWLRNECSRILNSSASQLPQDELAMAICRVLDSDEAVDEIAGDLLNLVGDGAFETVHDLLTHRKELVDAIHHGEGPNTLAVTRTAPMKPGEKLGAQLYDEAGRRQDLVEIARARGPTKGKFRYHRHGSEIKDTTDKAPISNADYEEDKALISNADYEEDKALISNADYQDHEFHSDGGEEGAPSEGLYDQPSREEEGFEDESSLAYDVDPNLDHSVGSLSIHTGKLLVSGLAPNITEEILVKSFKQYGEIMATSLARDQQNNSLGYGYVIFESADDAALCKVLMDNTYLNGSFIQIGYDHDDCSSMKSSESSIATPSQSSSRSSVASPSPRATPRASSSSSKSSVASPSPTATSSSKSSPDVVPKENSLLEIKEVQGKD